MRKAWSARALAASQADRGREGFAVEGSKTYPDATFTPRISYGQVEGWTWRGATIGTVHDLRRPVAASHGSAARSPFRPRWIGAQASLTGDTIFNLATNDDIVGGNSGSPLLNAKGEVIGAAFDGDVLSIGGDYGYDAAVNRLGVAVSAAAITEALTERSASPPSPWLRSSTAPDAATRSGGGVAGL